MNYAKKRTHVEDVGDKPLGERDWFGEGSRSGAM